MKDWKERFIQEHCYKKEEGETEYVMKPRSGDVMLKLIEQILSKRDKEIIKIIEGYWDEAPVDEVIKKIKNKKYDKRKEIYR